MSLSGATLMMKKPALLDVGAAGKGYLIDLVADVIGAHGISTFLIDAGGDILHRSARGERIRVGFEHPDDTSQVIGVVALGDESIAGSAGNRRAWGNYHHIIDPDTLSSPTHIRATWAIAQTTLLSDMLTTALYFVDPKVLLPHFSFEYLILFEDLSIERSEGLDAEFF
jgi:thiamine biosynthesis lipoprotein